MPPPLLAEDAPHTEGVATDAAQSPDAQPPPAGDEVDNFASSFSDQRHDGLFVRLTAGAGAGTAGYDEVVNGALRDVESRGLTGLLEVAVGAAVRDNLILHGNLLVAGFGDAKRRVDGIPDASLKPSTTTVMLGVGPSYYFPRNVYITASMGAAWFEETRGGEYFRTGIGGGACFAAGKEWWVGRAGAWGIGAALRAGLTTGRAELAGTHTRVRTGHIGLAISATYN
jgi:hypothetical protein